MQYLRHTYTHKKIVVYLNSNLIECPTFYQITYSSTYSSDIDTREVQLWLLKIQL